MSAVRYQPNLHVPGAPLRPVRRVPRRRVNRNLILEFNEVAQQQPLPDLDGDLNQG